MKKDAKRFCALLLTGILAVSSFVGCGKTEEKEQSSQVVSSATSSEVSKSSEVTEESKQGPITTDPITISVLCDRVSTTTNDAKDLWYFKYLEWWMNEQGYNVTIEVQQTTEKQQQISLMLGTDSLPDLVWGIDLSKEQAVTYGVEEGMILDWAPYLNEETMPNLMALLEDYPDAIAGSTAPDGGIYGLPTLIDRGWGQAAGNGPGSICVNINMKWLEECGIKEVPDTLDEFIDMLRAFRDNIKLESGEEVIPLVNNAGLFEQYLWACLGYYGGSSKNGISFAIKNEEVWLPAATEDYKTYIEIMKTLYDEKLISEDYFTMDTTTARGLMSADVCGVLGDYGLATTQPEDFADWVSVVPMTIGDTEKVATSVNATYTFGKIWASASTEYPEVLAVLLDYVYSDEGSTYYAYGPQKGKDPLNLLSGWYYDENGVITNDEIASGKSTYTDHYSWCAQYVYPSINTGNAVAYNRYSRELAGLDSNIKTTTYKDAITGQTVNVVEKITYTEDNADGYTRYSKVAAWEAYCTTVKLPSVFMSEDETLRAAELRGILEEHINAETAKFITGLRPISEIDDYFKELEGLDVDEYVEMYRTAYSTYMDAVFN